MVIKSFSKINLSLKINFKSKKKGLHEIQSLYCLINLFDKIEILKIKRNKDEITFKGPFAKLVKKENNSIRKLLEKLRMLKLISGYYSIAVTKNIPVFGGLGGGTSNAAFILKFLLKNKVNYKLLDKLEKTVGSDLKLFFVKQGFLKDLNTIIKFKKKHELYFILVQPKIKCSTQEIYSKVKKFTLKEKFNLNFTKSKTKFLEYLSSNGNDLQMIVENKYPQIKKILKDIKNKQGCYLSRMTGTGSVCYGLFKDNIYAKKAINKLKIKYPKLWVSSAKTV